MIISSWNVCGFLLSSSCLRTLGFGKHLLRRCFTLFKLLLYWQCEYVFNASSAENYLPIYDCLVSGIWNTLLLISTPFSPWLSIWIQKALEGKADIHRKGWKWVRNVNCLVDSWILSSSWISNVELQGCLAVILSNRTNRWNVQSGKAR